MTDVEDKEADVDGVITTGISELHGDVRAVIIRDVSSVVITHTGIEERERRRVVKEDGISLNESMNQSVKPLLLSVIKSTHVAVRSDEASNELENTSHSKGLLPAARMTKSEPLVV